MMEVMMENYRKYALQCIKFMPMPLALYKAYKENGYTERLDNVIQRTAALLEENKEVTKTLEMHYRQILPCIAFYEDLKELFKDDQALHFYNEHVLKEVAHYAEKIRKFAQFPGVLKSLPKIMKFCMDHIFNEKAGFTIEHLSYENGFQVDILTCPYVRVCQKYNVPEIVHGFCNSDGLMYGNLHSSLAFQREGTLASGNKVCDFKLVKK